MTPPREVSPIHVHEDTKYALAISGFTHTRKHENKMESKLRASPARNSRQVSPVRGLVRKDRDDDEKEIDVNGQDVRNVPPSVSSDRRKKSARPSTLSPSPMKPMMKASELTIDQSRDGAVVKVSEVTPGSEVSMVRAIHRLTLAHDQVDVLGMSQSWDDGGEAREGNAEELDSGLLSVTPIKTEVDPQKRRLHESNLPSTPSVNANSSSETMPIFTPPQGSSQGVFASTPAGKEGLHSLL